VVANVSESETVVEGLKAELTLCPGRRILIGEVDVHSGDGGCFEALSTYRVSQN
jgi:hypothetical protein